MFQVISSDDFNCSYCISFICFGKTKDYEEEVEEEESDKEEEEETESKKQLKSRKKATYGKSESRKKTKKETELDRWAKLMSSHFEDVENFHLSFD